MKLIVIVLLVFTTVCSSCSSKLTRVTEKPRKYEGKTVTVKGQVVSWIELGSGYKFVVIRTKHGTTLPVLIQVPALQMWQDIKVKGVFYSTADLAPTYKGAVVIDSSNYTISLRANRYYRKFLPELEDLVVNRNIETTLERRDTLPEDMDKGIKK